jgi:hypothetical protein
MTGTTVAVKLADGVAHLAGLQTCGSVHSCPVCAPKIRHRRSQEVDQLTREWMARHPDGAVLFLTVTAPHVRMDSLSELLKAIKGGWRSIMSGRAWKDDKQRYGVGHWLRVWDVTVGANGWHPHLHCLFFVTRKLDPAELNELEGRMFSRLSSALPRLGHHRAASRERGVRLEVARSLADVAAYMAKAGVEPDEGRPSRTAMELARGDLKQANAGGRTPFQVLQDFADTGDVEALGLWHEWEAATSGLQWMRSSNGLRAMLDVAAQTDEEIAAEEIGGETVCYLTRDEWHAVTKHRAGPITLLELAELGGAEAVAGFLHELVVKSAPKKEPSGCG